VVVRASWLPPATLLLPGHLSSIALLRNSPRGGLPSAQELTRRTTLGRHRRWCSTPVVCWSARASPPRTPVINGLERSLGHTVGALQPQRDHRCIMSYASQRPSCNRVGGADGVRSERGCVAHRFLRQSSSIRVVCFLLISAVHPVSTVHTHEMEVGHAQLPRCNTSLLQNSCTQNP
jgi:hypothetical protein